MRLKLCNDCPIWPIVEEVKSSLDPATGSSHELNSMVRVINSAHKGISKNPEVDMPNLRMYISPSGYKDLPLGIGSLCTAKILDSVSNCFTTPCEGKITP